MPELNLDADIELLPTDAGGKQRTIRNGYRPLLWFGETGPAGEPELHSAVLTMQQGADLAPGEKGSVVITPLAWETWPQIGAGTEFDVFDGGRYVGRGVLRTSPQESLSELEVRRRSTSRSKNGSSSAFVIGSSGHLE